MSYLNVRQTNGVLGFNLNVRHDDPSDMLIAHDVHEKNIKI